MLYTLDSSKHAEAIHLLEKAAKAGDSVSADYLSNRSNPNFSTADISRDRAWPLQVQLATPRNTK